ncbi:MtnX-like HAD-IB family phosphatase [Alicyclobacillus curvatus]|nr:MtnX-like HAD-IB family phosphatase [Alicyclobacillus curvatus]
MKHYPVGVFCDFDGTISKSDLIASIAYEFAGQTGRDLVRRVQHRELTVREGVEAIFQTIPSARLPEIKSYTQQLTVVREGFDDLVRECIRRGWLFAVVSGGLDIFVHPVVEPYRSKIEVFANHLDDSGETLSIQWNVTCDDLCDGGCGMCKPTVLRRFKPYTDVQVVIGDGVTDVKAAAQADYVFARDSLLRVCREQGIACSPFESLAEIIPVLDEEVSL